MDTLCFGLVFSVNTGTKESWMWYSHHGQTRPATARLGTGHKVRQDTKGKNMTGVFNSHLIKNVIVTCRIYVF